MGKLLGITCPDCRGKWTLRLGYGLMHGSADTVAGLFPEDIRTMLPIEAMRRRDIGWEFAMEPAVCASCGSFVDVPVLRLLGGDQIHVAPCPACGGGVEVLSEADLGGAPCPSCGRGGLQIMDAGLWD